MIFSCHGYGFQLDGLFLFKASLVFTPTRSKHREVINMEISKRTVLLLTIFFFQRL